MATTQNTPRDARHTTTGGAATIIDPDVATEAIRYAVHRSRSGIVGRGDLPWQERRRILYDLLSQEAYTTEMLVALRLFPSKDRAQTWLRHQERRGRVRCNGTINLRDVGADQKVWTKGWIARSNMLAHCVWQTYVRWAINPGRFECRNVDKDLRPDMEIFVRNDVHPGGIACYVELDMGEESYEFIERRYALYAKRFPLGSPPRGPILWIVHADTFRAAETRMEGLRSRAATIKHLAMFTTTHRLLRKPDGAVYQDFAGSGWRLGKGDGQPLGQGIGMSIGDPFGVS